MTKTHWKKLHNPDYLGAYALEPGKDMVVTVKSVGDEMVTGADGKKEECMVMHFREAVRPMIVNVTNARTIERIYRTPYVEDWVGKPIQLYVAQVRAFGETVDALRIRPQAPAATVCAGCGQPIKAYGKLSAAEMAAYTHKKYGRSLCEGCAREAAAKADPLSKGKETQDGA